jgi:VanZ family protein
MELHAELRGAMSKWSRTAGTVFVAVAAYGGLDELTQPLTNRTCDPWDFAADVVGAALGLFLYRRFLREHFIGPSGAADDRALELKR